jgi:hypothetical protein
MAVAMFHLHLSLDEVNGTQRVEVIIVLSMKMELCFFVFAMAHVEILAHITIPSFGVKVVPEVALIMVLTVVVHVMVTTLATLVAVVVIGLRVQWCVPCILLDNLFLNGLQGRLVHHDQVEELSKGYHPG